MLYANWLPPYSGAFHYQPIGQRGTEILSQHFSAHSPSWEHHCPTQPLPSSSARISVDCRTTPHDYNDEDELTIGYDLRDHSVGYDGKENLPLRSSDERTPQESGGDVRRPFDNISNSSNAALNCVGNREFRTELERHRYLERRSKNNEAAKQSRNKRREREKYLEERVKLLEEENQRLKEALKTEQQEKRSVLISRNYRGDVDIGIIEKFVPLLVDLEEEGQLAPVVDVDSGTHMIWIRFNNFYVVAVSRCNANVSLVQSFLYKLVGVLAEYFKDVEEESIRDNFVIIYELLDEMMDFGYPQITEGRILREYFTAPNFTNVPFISLRYITQVGHKLEASHQPRPPMAVTNAVSWRSEGVKHRKNEVFLDVIESLNLLASGAGTVLQSEIVGSVKMRVFLTGMPELRLGLNDKVQFDASGRGRSKAVELEDIKFHQCVRLSRFENDRTISFIPPDGELSTVVKPLIWVEAVIEKFSHSRVEYMVKAKSQFKRRSTANNVEIIVPAPNYSDSPRFKTAIGNCRYQPEENSFVWNIKNFPGGKEYLMRAHFKLPSVLSGEAEGKRPIKVRFEIPYFTTSGIQVRYLKIIEKSGYQALPWVRYITQSGDYSLRLNSAT
uniref:MHD domain-containing protein n=1 Tax=Globodera pallida TaxID=36090 RepID=A0A183CMA7_GLOPA